MDNNDERKDKKQPTVSTIQNCLSSSSSFLSFCVSLFLLYPKKTFYCRNYTWLFLVFSSIGEYVFLVLFHSMYIFCKPTQCGALFSQFVNWSIYSPHFCEYSVQMLMNFFELMRSVEIFLEDGNLLQRSVPAWKDPQMFVGPVDIVCYEL